MQHELLPKISDDLVFHLLNRQESVVANRRQELQLINGIITERQRDIQVLRSLGCPSNVVAEQHSDIQILELARQTHKYLLQKNETSLHRLAKHARERNIDCASLAMAQRKAEHVARCRMISANTRAIQLGAITRAPTASVTSVNSMPKALIPRAATRRCCT